VLGSLGGEFDPDTLALTPEGWAHPGRKHLSARHGLFEESWRRGCAGRDRIVLDLAEKADSAVLATDVLAQMFGQDSETGTLAMRACNSKMPRHN
jgi:hypothetical protein